jgi:cell division protein FtsQ
MKLVYKRSSAATASATALAEPPEVYASEPARPEPSPAPAGALHRVYPATQAAPEPPQEDEYVPQRGSYGFRLRGGLPRSLGGRILLGSATLFVLGAATLTVAAVRQFLFHDPRFSITTSTEISVEGNEHISRTDVLGVFGSDLERNIFKIPLPERRADLERLPWVAHATVERLLPNHLRVHVIERTPIAFVRQGSHIGLVDADGVLLDMPPESAGDPHYSFPVLTGLASDDTPEMRSSRMDVYRRFMADLDSGGQRRTQAISEVDVTNPEDVKALVTLNGADILVHFGDEQFLHRYQSFAQHLPEWRTQYPKLASADMRYERQVVLEMQGGAAPPVPEASINPGAQPAVPAPLPVHRTVSAVVPKHPLSRDAAANQRLFHELAQRRAQQARLRAERR